MYLDKRSISILKEVISNPNISSKELEVKKNLSRRQIKYSLEKVNDWLEANNYPKVKRLATGKFVVDRMVLEVFTDNGLITAENFIPSENDRVLLLLIILLSQEDLSLFHFTNALKVSNVTVLNDMKRAQKKLDAYGLKIVYTRTKGYQLEGEEWTLRNLLHEILQEISNVHGGLAVIQDFAMLEINRINSISKIFERIEEMLKIRFTDEKMQLLPYYIGIIFGRVRMGKIIRFDPQILYKELSDTKEYEAMEMLIGNEESLPEIEKLYVTLQLLSANIFSGDLLTAGELPLLKKALHETLNNFEENSFLEFKDKDYLVKRLMLHLKPAYYRIKYNLTSFNSYKAILNKDYMELDQIVKVSLRPLEAFIKNPIPDSERYYLTIFIGSYLLQSNQILSTRKKALVVCKNGVTISKLMRNTLTKLFPEFEFYPTMSLREYMESVIEADLIFSPVPVKTESLLFIINPLLTEEEKWNLRSRVMKKIFGVNNETLNIDKLVKLIGKSSTINDKERLIKDLQKYFGSSYSNESYIQKNFKPNLVDLIRADTITIMDQVSDWKTAIRIASTPLLENNSITEDYVEKMIASHSFEHPYMVLGKYMAIPHANPDCGVNKLGMSLLIIKKGVLFSSKFNVHFVVVIAPTDTEQHVNAIYQLTNLSMNEEILQKILLQTDKEKILELMKDTQVEKLMLLEGER